MARHPKKIPVSVPRETVYKNMTPAASSSALVNLREAAAVARTEGKSWRAETLKHLVIMHVAGLAAAASVFASTSSEALRIGSVSAARVCGGSLAGLILLMGFYWIGSTIDSDRMDRFIEIFVNNGKPLESRPRFSFVRFVDTLLIALGAETLFFFVLALFLAFPKIQQEQTSSTGAETVVAYCFELPDDVTRTQRDATHCDRTTSESGLLLSRRAIR